MYHLSPTKHTNSITYHFVRSSSPLKNNLNTQSQIINHFVRSAEYISLYVDDRLRKGVRGEADEELDRVLERAMVLFKYLRDKDVFERYYKVRGYTYLGTLDILIWVDRRLLSCYLVYNVREILCWRGTTR